MVSKLIFRIFSTLVLGALGTSALGNDALTETLLFSRGGTIEPTEPGYYDADAILVSPPVQCFLWVESRLHPHTTDVFTDPEKVKLCRGAKDPMAPITCYLDSKPGRTGLMEKATRIELCSGS